MIQKKIESINIWFPVECPKYELLSWEWMIAIQKKIFKHIILECKILFVKSDFRRSNKSILRIFFESKKIEIHALPPLSKNLFYAKIMF